ncbi:MAG: hypothetical protein QF570_02470 [Myxococcota bacterium]|jgi:hypothetical protein|nr:hypothetical protein [Myxococcota bacterium]
MDVPEIIPVPLAPDTQKSLTPSAVKRSHPPFHDPRKEGEGQADARKKRQRAGGDVNEAAAADNVVEDDASSETRGQRIDLRA